MTKMLIFIFNADILLYIGNNTIGEKKNKSVISFNRINPPPPQTKIIIIIITHIGDSKNMGALIAICII